MLPAAEKKIVAVLESMWDWRQMTSGAGYREAPRSFRINPDNFSGKRLYRIVGSGANLLVTNSCRELCASANHHGIPDPGWLRENLEILEPFAVLLVCGKVAQATYARSGFRFSQKLEIPHPAARMWTHAMLDAATRNVRELCA
jgi:hypothetical protein